MVGRRRENAELVMERDVRNRSVALSTFRLIECLMTQVARVMEINRLEAPDPDVIHAARQMLVVGTTDDAKHRGQDAKQVGSSHICRNRVPAGDRKPVS